MTYRALRLGAVVVVCWSWGLLAVARADATAERAATVNQYRRIGCMSFGVKGGVNLATFGGSGADEPSLRVGMVLGGFGVYRFNEKFSLAPELIASGKGSKYVSRGGVDQNENLVYVDLPILARYEFRLRDDMSVFGFAGPSLAYLVDSKAREKSQLRTFDISAVVGVGVDVTLGDHAGIFDLRYSLGFINTLDPGADEGELGAARNRVISFLIGFTT